MVTKGYVGGEESPGKQLKKYYDRRATDLAQMKRITDDAAAEGRATLDADEKAAFESWEGMVADEDRLIAKLQKQIEEEKRMPTVPAPAAETFEQVAERYGVDEADRRFARTSAPVMRAADGSEYRMLGPEHRMADIYAAKASVRDNNLSIGRMIKGMVTGNWRDADAERRALGETANVLGGYLVPDALWSQVLDAARAQSAFVQAGARVVPMETETLGMPMIDSDPTFAVKAEHSAWSESNINFGMGTLVAKTYGALIRVSNELLEDAPMAAQAIETSLTRGLAQAIDSACLIGSSGGINGITNNLTIVANQTGSVGAVEWADLHNAVVTVQGNNFEPNAYIVHPTIAGDFDILASGDGTTSAKLWQGPPPSVSGVRRFRTTTIGTAKVLVGDFSYAVFGVRMQPTIEISRVADDALAKYQTLIRIVWRGDSIVLRPEAFHLLAGITT